MRKISVVSLLIGGLLIFYSLSLLAEVRVFKLYEAEIEVKGQGQDDREQAMKAGLLEVLTRVSGKQNLDHDSQITDAMTTMSKYVLSTRYQRKAADEGTQLVMWIKYNPSMVNRLLAQADLPVWDDKRPTTLIWLAIEDGRNRYILGSGEGTAVQAEFKNVLTELAKKRGVPVLFPIMDLEDTTRIRYSDISGSFIDAVKKASKRYGTDAILLGSVRRNGDNWQGRWTLLEKDNSHNFDASLQNMQSLVRGGINGLANYLSNVESDASPLVNYEDNSSNLKVTIGNIDSMNAYAELLKMISELKSIKRAEVLGLYDSYVLFSIEMKQDRGNFSQAARSIDKLKPVRSGIDSSSSDTLNYRYTP